MAPLTAHVFVYFHDIIYSILVLNLRWPIDLDDHKLSANFHLFKNSPLMSLAHLQSAIIVSCFFHIRSRVVYRFLLTLSRPNSTFVEHTAIHHHHTPDIQTDLASKPFDQL
jgi:hypothetical protein